MTFSIEIPQMDRLGSANLAPVRPYAMTPSVEFDSYWRTRTISEAKAQGCPHLRATCVGLRENTLGETECADYRMPSSERRLPFRRASSRHTNVAVLPRPY